MSKPIIHPQSGMAPWPDDWPRRYETNEPCDMAVGPCACGAWHFDGDFEVRAGVLYSGGEIDPKQRRRSP